MERKIYTLVEINYQYVFFSWTWNKSCSVKNNVDFSFQILFHNTAVIVDMIGRHWVIMPISRKSELYFFFFRHIIISITELFWIHFRKDIDCVRVNIRNSSLSSSKGNIILFHSPFYYNYILVSFKNKYQIIKIYATHLQYFQYDHDIIVITRLARILLNPLCAQD